MLKKLVLVLILGSSAIIPQTVLSKYAGEFLAIGVGGRPLGMGGAYTAIANDVTAGYYNPAGLANLNYPQISLMHDERYGNLVNYNYAAFALPYGSEYSFGLSVMRLGVDGIPDTRNALIDRSTGQVIYDINSPAAKLDPSLVKEFSNQDWAIYLTGAKRHSKDLYFGINMKLIYRKIAEFSATGIGFDAGVMYFPAENLSLGANVQDVTTTLVGWSTGRNELISPTLKLGAAYKLEVFGLAFSPALDFDVRFEGREYAAQFNMGPVSIDPHFGGELSYKNLFAVRGGYNDVKQFTMGAGVRLPKLNIDYSFARFTMSEEDRLPDTHRISLILTLEEARFLRSVDN